MSIKTVSKMTRNDQNALSWGKQVYFKPFLAEFNEKADELNNMIECYNRCKSNDLV